MPEPTPVPDAAEMLRSQKLLVILDRFRQSANRGFQERVEADLEAVAAVESLYASPDASRPDAAELAKKLEEIRGDAQLLASAIDGEARWQSLKRLSDQLDLTIHEAITLATSPESYPELSGFAPPSLAARPLPGGDG